MLVRLAFVTSIQVKAEILLIDEVLAVGDASFQQKCFEARLAEDLLDPVFAATLRTELGHTIIVARSDEHGGASGQFKAGESVVARFELPNWLTPSRYMLTPSLARAGTGADALALVEDMSSVVVHGQASGGILELPVDVRIERV